MRTRYPTITHKRGAAFGLVASYLLPPGTWTATANVEQADGTLVTALTCALTTLAELDASGNTAALAISATTAQTSLWPLATLLCDVRFTDTGGNALPTSTFAIVVEREITAP